MKIAFYKGLKSKHFIDKLISVATLSEYSHCEIVFSDGVSASASRRDGGVRFKKIDYTINPDRWDIYEIVNPYGLEAENLIRYFFSIHDEDEYDYIGACGSWLRLDLSSDGRMWCSQVCALALCENEIVTPGKLYKNLKKRGII